MDKQAFHSKILLFGEYSIIQESMGLSLPYELFYGQLSFDKTEVNEEFVLKSQEQLRAFSRHLAELNESNKFYSKIDVNQLNEDLENGVYFKSSIPQGFGVGSSGALCAAVYDNYAVNKVDINKSGSKNELNGLKSDLGMMESYFHGKSSGVDPLICYLNLPLLIKGADIKPVKFTTNVDGKGAIFLIDTGDARKTEPLVNYYLQRMEEGSFREFIEKQLKPFTNNCIQAFLNGDHETLFGYLTKLSRFQFDHFKPMIPRLFNKLWKKGLDSGDYYLKLCGAGGGGFILGFTQNYEQTQETLKDHQLELVCRI